MTIEYGEELERVNNELNEALKREESLKNDLKDATEKYMRKSEEAKNLADALNVRPL